MTIDAHHIARLQTDLTAAWHHPPACAIGEDFDRLISENHLHNFLLWHEEDIARRDDLGPERVCQAKRAIDRYNQQRNNFIEEMDRELVADLNPSESGCPKNSETPGMIIDRLSILALKEYHMREESERTDAGDAHRAHQRAPVRGVLLDLAAAALLEPPLLLRLLLLLAVVAVVLRVVGAGRLRVVVVVEDALAGRHG